MFETTSSQAGLDWPLPTTQKNRGFPQQMRQKAIRSHPYYRAGRGNNGNSNGNSNRIDFSSPISPTTTNSFNDLNNNPESLNSNLPPPSTQFLPPGISVAPLRLHTHQYPQPLSAQDVLENWTFPETPVEHHPAAFGHQLQQQQQQLQLQLQLQQQQQQQQQQHGRAEDWQNALSSYNYATIPQNTAPFSDETPSPLTGQAQDFTRHEVAFSWDAPNHNKLDFSPDRNPGSFSDSEYRNFGSFDSITASNASTIASSISEGYIMPGSSVGVESSGGLSSLPDDLFRAVQDVSHSSMTGTGTGNSISPISPTSSTYLFPLDDDFTTTHGWMGVAPVYSNEIVPWPSAIVPQEQQIPEFQYGQSTTNSQMPWCSQDTIFDANRSSGGVSFEPAHGSGFDSYIPRDTTPTEESDSSLVSCYATSSVPSQSSPRSPYVIVDSPHQTPSPPHHNDHQHVFTLYPGIKKSTQKNSRGRQRPLTSKEKQEAREVREAKACWACHLSKIKCSPCSPGSPCRKCAELIGKRRFCLLPCFNDPLQSLHTFMVPDYLHSHFTRANVEQFVRRNSTGWGSDEILIRMTWGYWKPLEATVVSLDIPRNSQIGFHHSASCNGANKPTLVRKTSPPLGIPLAAMDALEDEYSLLVHRIVHDDLSNYVSIAYDDQESELPERLLTSIGRFYSASKAAGQESELLRQALEIHVICSILERSLNLDDESKHRVERYFHATFPPRSAARCVQRQVKLAFFEVQRKRVMRVLEDWGNMMWSSNKGTSSDKKWATSFSVFLALILSLDKILGRAYYFCETRIEHYGAEALSERRQFRDLARLTQNELFERCKEIFHTSFKTRKNGREACNPIRDGLMAFKTGNVNAPVEMFVEEVRGISLDFRQEIKSHRSSVPDPSYDDQPFLDAGRLSCIFLDDFLEN